MCIFDNENIPKRLNTLGGRFSHYKGCQGFQVWSINSKTKNVYRLEKGLAEYEYGKLSCFKHAWLNRKKEGIEETGERMCER